MFKWLKNLLDDWNEVQNELNKLGIFNYYNGWNGFITYVNPEVHQRLNTADDKSKTIPTKDR